MKIIPVHLAHFLSTGEARHDLWTLAKFMVFLCAVVTVFAVLFHILMARFEGQDHSWLTGFYWTLTVMSTLGFGDITFHSDIGRLFSIIVLLSGIILLLIVLPFAFIRFFYAPLLEAQLRLQAPQQLPEETADHLIIAAYDNVAPALIAKLKVTGPPYVVIEPDVETATRLHTQGVQVVHGDLDDIGTYRRANVQSARMVFANRSDTLNTNIILTLRQALPHIPITALAESEDSIDILELAGATRVLPLKLKLGEQLAQRVRGGQATVRRIGAYRDLVIGELAARGTFLEGLALRESHLRRRTGLNVVAIWERGQLKPAGPHARLDRHSFPVVIGTAEQMERLEALLPKEEGSPGRVLVIGGGKVGRAAIRALHRRGMLVHVLEKDQALAERRLQGLADELVVGDAADREVLERAGLSRVQGVLLSTNDDAVNIYLAVYCRKLMPELHIVSRVTHGRNVEAMARAGADFVLSFTTLGVGAVHAALDGHAMTVLGEGVELFYVAVPASLAGRKLAESGIGARSGLAVIAIRKEAEISTALSGEMVLEPGSELLAIGTLAQRQEFSAAFK